MLLPWGKIRFFIVFAGKTLTSHFRHGIINVQFLRLKLTDCNAICFVTFDERMVVFP